MNYTAEQTLDNIFNEITTTLHLATALQKTETSYRALILELLEEKLKEIAQDGIRAIIDNDKKKSIEHFRELVVIGDATKWLLSLPAETCSSLETSNAA